MSCSTCGFDRRVAFACKSERALFAPASHDDAVPQAQTPGYGFNVHAGVRIAAHDRAGLERICRYVTRPELSQGRVSVGVAVHRQVHLTLKRAWPDGRTAVSFTPRVFMARLAAMVSPPRMHRTRYHGLWAPHAAHRVEATPAVGPRRRVWSWRTGCAGAGEAQAL